jgi:hypothetical protein
VRNVPNPRGNRCPTILVQCVLPVEHDGWHALTMRNVGWGWRNGHAMPTVAAPREGMLLKLRLLGMTSTRNSQTPS